jgi:hypothetical protein
MKTEKEPTYLELIGLGPEDLARYSKQETYEQQFNREIARSLEIEKQLIAQGRQNVTPPIQQTPIRFIRISADTPWWQG